MTPTQKGRFYNVCTKEVVDFTSENEEAIIHHFQDIIMSVDVLMHRNYTELSLSSENNEIVGCLM